MEPLTNIEIIFLIWNSKYKHAIQKFHSLIPINTETTNMEM